MKKIFFFITGFLIVQLSTNAQSTTIVINEFMADNTSTIADDSGKFEDWIEIYNFGEKPVNIGGLYVTDDFSNPKLFRIPVGNDSTILQPGSFTILWADDDWEEGIFHLEFKLSRKGEQIAFYETDGETLIDSVSFQLQETDKSFGRKVDNGKEWIQFSVPTPGRSNN